MNNLFGTDFDAQDRIDGVRGQLVADETIRQAAQANTKENFRYKLDPALDDALVDRLRHLAGHAAHEQVKE